MLRVGVTGGIGSGKTALTDWLATQGVIIVDADLAARSVVRPGQPALLEIVDEFGEEYLDSEGELDRAALRTLVFEDEAKRKKLEAITHPRIREELFQQMLKADSAYAVLSSPLLLESGQSDMVDLSVVVDVPEALQIKRTMERDQNDRTLVEQIMRAQLDRQSRIERADIVVDNSDTLEALHKRARALHYTLLARAQRD